MPPVARIGDLGSHGGPIVTGASRTVVERSPVARIGDIYNCAVHGPNPIVTGSSKTIIEHARVARIGDRTACGAVIITGGARTIDGG